jgi:hypothetical protein
MNFSALDSLTCGCCGEPLLKHGAGGLLTTSSWAFSPHVRRFMTYVHHVPTKKEGSLLNFSEPPSSEPPSLLPPFIGSGIMAERLSGDNVALALLADTIATGAILVALIFAFGGIRCTSAPRASAQVTPPIDCKATFRIKCLRPGR